ncbi:hypothetical protein Tsp_11768 [Trichinella spiralis]|uniref:hypothetical protein n=1 Tax=Trichinella spiralis TaxID=6334 RepID=UPI0001EFEA85|nr:hypothetical protein Tsp_13549 [Trichinella spiralis]XP_003374181.1 hypothetical protein Tsp_11768 [Trichinella spiralis]
MRAPRGASYRFFSYFLYCWCSPKTPSKISFPHQEDFQSFTFWNARDDLKISNVNLEHRITGATRMASSAGYGCYFNDGVAGCATSLASTITLLQPLIQCFFFTLIRPEQPRCKISILISHFVIFH